MVAPDLPTETLAASAGNQQESRLTLMPRNESVSSPLRSRRHAGQYAFMVKPTRASSYEINPEGYALAI
jgi:hypothetical protein